MDSEEADDLKELVVLVERGVEVLPEGPDLLYRIYGFGPTSILYRSDALDFHVSLVSRLCSSALSEGGQSPEAVADLIDQFVSMAKAGSENEGLAWLKAELLRPLESWTIAQSTPFILTIVNRLTVGDCTVTNSIDDADPRISSQHGDIISRRMPGPFIFTSVEARDAASARVLAIDRFGWAESVLALLTGWTPHLDSPHVIVRGDSVNFTTGRHLPLTIKAITADGTLFPGYRELADALGESDRTRSDWGRRTLAAARWYREAATSDWPSRKISASMSALEAILILPGETGEKKSAVADRLTKKIAKLKEMSERDQIKWLIDLYDRRSEALHAGRFHQDEIDAAGLELLTKSAVRWAVSHLSPDHRPGVNKGCSTIAEAMEDHS